MNKICNTKNALRQTFLKDAAEEEEIISALVKAKTLKEYRDIVDKHTYEKIHSLLAKKITGIRAGGSMLFYQIKQIKSPVNFL
jgi:uncharacterized protein YwlG (UPF0340 family)